MKKNLRGCLPTGILLVLLLSSLLLAGCSGGSKTAVVSGKVNYKGQPVTGGNLILQPSDGSGSQYLIPIKPDGTFSGSDVPIGSKQVAIDTEPAKSAGAHPYDMSKAAGAKKPDNAKSPEVDAGNQPKYVAIPKKYNDPKTSGLTWDIIKGKNEKTFELTD